MFPAGPGEGYGGTRFDAEEAAVGGGTRLEETPGGFRGSPLTGDWWGPPAGGIFCETPTEDTSRYSDLADGWRDQRAR